MSEVRLIDANALDDSFRHSIVKCKQWFEDAAVLGEEESKARADQACVTFMECSMRLKKQPTVDAVPVVRCKDCRWACLAPQRQTATCMKKRLPSTHDYDFFCADGERIEHEQIHKG